MRRRDFVALISGASAVWPFARYAQTAERMRRVGVFSGLPNESTGQEWFRSFKARLGELGWDEGRNLRIDYRWAAGTADRVRDLASDMVGTSPDAILAMTTPALSALRQQTPSIPLVFVNVSDPVAGGFVDSMARPGRNITGFTSFETSIGGKWLELLKEAAPSLERVLVVFSPQNYSSRALLQAIGNVAPSLGVHVVSAEVHDTAEIKSAINRFAQDSGAGGFILLPDPVTSINQQEIIDLAINCRQPGLHTNQFFAEHGGLMSYGPDYPELYREAATYVDRILKGTNVAELPVQNPTKYDLALNQKTAKAIGLTFSAKLLAIADEVIE
jgi:putative tryptophan/tyrosine transport system substrate-binding protein